MNALKNLASAFISGNTISDNTGTANYYGWGAGLFATTSPHEFEISGNTFENNTQSNPNVVQMRNGFVAVWQSGDQDGSGYGIYGQRFDSNGNKIKNEFRINHTVSGSQVFPVTAALSDGFIVIWDSYDQDGSGKGVYGQRFDINGNVIGSEFLINTYTNNNQSTASAFLARKPYYR